MVSVCKYKKRLRIILSPNRSLSWRGNQLFILSLLILSGIICTGFALMGGWVILPFAGLELSMLSGCLYYVSRKLSYRHVIELEEKTIRIEKGIYYPKQKWQFSVDEVKIEVDESGQGWGTPNVCLLHKTEKIALGEFLNQTETLEFVSKMREKKFRVHSSTPIKISA